MIELFYMGGPLFMGILTLIFISMLIIALTNGLPVLRGASDDHTYRKIGYIKEVGLFGLIVGLLGTLIGLYSAFVAIEQMESISAAMLAGGLKVAMITTLYGFLIFILSYLIWLGLSWKLSRS